MGLAPIILGITTPCFALQRTSTTNHLVRHMHGHCRIRYTFWSIQKRFLISKGTSVTNHTTPISGSYHQY